MQKNISDVKELVGELVGRCRMTQEEIANYIGVNKYVVTLWKQGKATPNQQNYEKLSEMVARLEKFAFYFPRMAISILMNEDYMTDIRRK